MCQNVFMAPLTTLTSEGIEFSGQAPKCADEVLTPGAVRFVAELSRRFETTRQELLRHKQQRQQEIVDGRMPDFLPERAAIRERSWTVAPIPKDLQDRRVEITGPVERKMVINALNSGANVFMADFEDSNTPTWQNLIQGQRNLKDAVRRTITYTDPQTGKAYKLNESLAVMLVRP